MDKENKEICNFWKTVHCAAAKAVTYDGYKSSSAPT